ncbi:MAG: GAF domain-containing protein, partial [Anaerolineae bacterium]|nr:GAF domain-containing protein [Anaerolineae bacterium]
LRLLRENERDDISAYWIEFLQTKKLSGEYTFQKSDGSKAIFEYRAVADIIPHRHLLVMNDITERKQQEIQLIEAKTLLEKTFASLNEVVMVVDPTTRTLLMCNPAVESVFGYAPAEIIGQNTTFMHIDDDHYRHFGQLYTTALEQHGIFQAEYPVRRKDGTVIITEMTIIPQHEDDQWQKGVIGVFRDITARKQMEQAEHEQRILAEALRDTITALTSTLELKEVMHRILENVGHVVPHESANIMLIEGDQCRIAYLNGYSETDRAYLTQQLLSLQVPNLHAMLATRQPQLVANVKQDPGWLNIPGTEWIHSHLGVPICRQGQVIGFLNLDSSVPGFFTPTHIERLKSFADQAAIAIENAQVYVTLSQFANEMATLNRATAYLFAPMSSSQGIEELGQKIVYAVLKAFGKVDCGIMLIDQESNQLIRLVREGEYHVQATTPLYLDGAGLAPEAIRRREMVYAPDVSVDPHYIRSDPRTRSELVIPLQMQDGIIGVLDLQSDELDAFS